MDSKGEISRDKFKAALDAVDKYQKLAKKHGAEEILAIATEALREARNNQDFIEAIKRETGLEVQLISGYAEAVLDYFGATYSHDTPIGAGVLDVGGGSAMANRPTGHLPPTGRAGARYRTSDIG